MSEIDKEKVEVQCLVLLTHELKALAGSVRRFRKIQESASPDEIGLAVFEIIRSAENALGWLVTDPGGNYIVILAPETVASGMTLSGIVGTATVSEVVKGVEVIKT